MFLERVVAEKGTPKFRVETVSQLMARFNTTLGSAIEAYHAAFPSKKPGKLTSIKSATGSSKSAGSSRSTKLPSSKSAGGSGSG